MPNFELPNDEVLTITINTVDAGGTIVPAPVGDVFTATSSSASLNAVIGTDAAGHPALVVNALVQVSPNITVTVADSAGLTSAQQVFDIVQDVAPANIVLNVAGSTHVPQPVPVAPGP